MKWYTRGLGNHHLICPLSVFRESLNNTLNRKLSKHINKQILRILVISLQGSKQGFKQGIHFYIIAILSISCEISELGEILDQGTMVDIWQKFKLQHPPPPPPLPFSMFFNVECCKNNPRTCVETFIQA